MRKMITICVVLLAGTTWLITGCSNHSSNSTNEHSNTSISVSVSTSVNADSSSNSPQPVSQPKDGTVVSMKRLTSGLTHSDVYDLYYESAGVKIEAYVELPNQHGSYPLMILCHGGYPFPYPEVHHYNFGWTYDDITEHTAKAIYVYPEYRGYLKSTWHEWRSFGHSKRNFGGGVHQRVHCKWCLFVR